MAFGRKKIEKPKSQLGLALYDYDNIFKKRLESILKSIMAKKKLNAKNTKKILELAFIEMDRVTENISKENFKTDYRSDKIRDMLINLLNFLKNNLTKAGNFAYDFTGSEGLPVLSEIEKVPQLREEIRKKMKDIEGDYI